MNKKHDKSSKISDVNVSSQGARSLDDMSNVTSAAKENLEKTEKIFDSGIVSEYLSTEVLSEADIDVSTSMKEDANADVAVNENTSSIAKNSSEDSSTSEKEEPMRLDSGIDVDVSDGFSSSRIDVDNASAAEKKLPEKESTPVQPVPKRIALKPLDEKEVWDCFFAQDNDGDTGLHIAFLQEKDDYIQQIIRSIPDSHYLDVQNYYYQTCLHLSVLLNKPKLIRLLLLAGAKTGLEDRNGNTALHLACVKNNLACVKQLLEPVTAYERKYTIFKYTPKIDSPSEYLNEYNFDGLSCVHIAANHSDLKILRQLFIFGADVNIRECKGGYTILHEGVRTGNYRLVNYILQHSGIDIEKKNYARLTPYQLSTYHSNVAKILLDKGATRLMTLEDESDDDYSSDENEDDDRDGYHEECVRTNEVSNMILNLSTKEPSNRIVT